MEFNSLDDGEDFECKGIGLVDVTEIFVTQDEQLFGIIPVALYILDVWLFWLTKCHLSGLTTIIQDGNFPISDRILHYFCIMEY